MWDFYVRFAVQTFTKRKLRSWLTMLGIFIGIAAIVSLISLGQGLKTAIGAQFQGLGTDRIIVQAKSFAFGAPGQNTAVTLTKDDLNRVEKVPGVLRVASRIIKSAKIEFNDQVQFTGVGSLPSTTEGARFVIETIRLKAAQGRMLDAHDKKKVMVGHSYADKAKFGKAVQVGSTLLVNGEPFEVVGVLDKLGNPQFDNIILMPEDEMRALYNIPDEVSAITAQSAPGTNTEAVAQRIKKELRSFRGEKEGKETFNTQTSGQLLQTLGTVLTIVQAVLVGIASISLVVGGVGITNTMYTAVLERTNEIGVMKSVGARNRDILAIFLTESGLLGLTGGAIGIAIGIGLSKIVEFGAAQALGSGLVQASFPLYLVFGALGFSFVVGSLAGTLPAMQASKLSPVEALRY
jgi:putative ABC transport system permease protein